ncbi:MAG: cupin domain-containing protein [Rhodococcus sp. (in: high G+C Gram-positive bacteria)]|uniref:cupin domain-containing protein n=1 Tax=Rhodococcus sp. TaxID=1831 RepID=UPI003BB70D01
MSPAESTTAPAVLVAAGLTDLAEQNPIRPGTYSPHRAHSGQGFRITHVALDAGVELPEHSATSPIIVQIAQGSVDFVVGETTYRMEQGAILHLEAGVPHAVHSVEAARVIVTFLLG